MNDTYDVPIALAMSAFGGIADIGFWAFDLDQIQDCRTRIIVILGGDTWVSSAGLFLA